METLKFNFSHPFKGNARIAMPGKLNASYNHFLLDSKGSNLIETPLTDFQNGGYKIVPDWKYGNPSFVISRSLKSKITLLIKFLN
jgi:hypothetical protein